MNLKTLKKAIVAYVDFIKAVWSDIAYPLIITGGRNTNLEGYRIYGNSVQEGTPTPETPVEVQSVGDLVTEGEYAGKYKIPVRVRGKNLYNKELHLMTDNKWIDGGTGELVIASGSYSATEYVLCDGLQKQTVTLSPTSGQNPGISFYDIDKVFISGAKYTNKVSCTVTVPENAVYMRFCARTDCKEIFQIELGDGATSYEPYVVPKTVDIYLDEPLRKIEDYSDYIDFEKKVVVRKVGKTVFDGTEVWKTNAIKNSFYCSAGGANLSLAPKEVYCLSNKFKGYDWETIYNNYNRQEGSYIIGIALQGGNYFRVTPYQSLPTISEWKTQLAKWNDAGIPLTVWYAINDSEEEVKFSPLPQFKGTTIYEVQTKVNPSGIKAYYYG